MREEGRDEREKEEGDERKGDAVSKLQLPASGNHGPISHRFRKNVNYSQKNRNFYIPRSLTLPLPEGVPFGIL